MKFPQAIADLIPPADDKPHKEFDEEHLCNSVAEAKSLFTDAGERLRKPQCWQDLTGPLGAGFSLYSASGKPLQSAAKTGDLLKINVGGPLPLGHDWVMISHLISVKEKEVEAIALQVHPCAPPAEGNTEHFFDASATSTWIVYRQGAQVSAHYRGRREIANRESKDAVRAIRDKIVAAAAVIGLADLQWKSLLKGFLAIKDT